MKRLTLTAALMFTITLFAQVHFKGIPVEGKTSKFIAELEAIGFTQMEDEDGNDWYVGRHLNEDCVMVISSKGTIIHRVVVLFKPQNPEEFFIKLSNTLLKYSDRYKGGLNYQELWDEYGNDAVIKRLIRIGDESLMFSLYDDNELVIELEWTKNTVILLMCNLKK